MFASIVCADWGKDPKKRSAYAASVADRVVRPLARGCTVESLLAAGEDLPKPVLLVFNAVIGLPPEYFRAARDIGRLPNPANVLEWLIGLKWKEFAANVDSPGDWRVKTPFFAVAKGKGGLNAYLEAAGMLLRRAIEAATGDKSVFAVSGIPGTVSVISISSCPERW